MSLKNEALKGKEVLVWWLDSNHVEQLGVIYESPSTLLKRLNKPDASSDQRIPLYLPNGEIVYRLASELSLADTVFGHPDNASLKFLTASNILQNVARRYEQAFADNGDLHGIYTFTGWLLLAVNPYEDFPSLYEEQTLAAYVNKTLNVVPPHPFAVAESAYSAVLKNWASQSIIISGESGSGKTECSKHVLKYLAYVSDRRHGAQNLGIENRVLQTNPILEGFGNATTVRNTNSSRFGKLIKLHFDRKGRMLEASLATYLLAKSRVCHTPRHEKNYHIFYWMCQGTDVL